MNKWLSSRYVPFGSDMCQRCGNEKLLRLHSVQTDDGIIEVGCVCAARLCAGQEGDIKSAELRMDREERKFKKVQELRNSWVVYSDRGGKPRVSGDLGQTSIDIFYIKGKGYTTLWKDAPYFRSHKQAMTWCEEQV